METGQRGATPRDIRDLGGIYGVTDEAQVAYLMQLAREGKQQGWWQGQSFTVPLAHMNYVGFEQEATSLRLFHLSVVPGLVQTADYTRALHKGAIPRLDDLVIEERVEERKTRQQILNRENPPRLEIILDEAVLHRQVGGAAVMREQLQRLIEEGTRPGLTVQVLPFSKGAHAALESNFTILEFASQAPVVYVEGLAGHIYLERKDDLDQYQLVLEELRSLALSPQDSAEMLARSRDAYAT